MLSAGNRNLSVRQIAAAASLVALLACLAISLRRNSTDSMVANRDELEVLGLNPTAICDVKIDSSPMLTGY